MIILVTGGRSNHRQAAAHYALEPFASPGNILIAGGAPGWDEACRKVWHKFELPYVVVPARWEALGKKAGPLRNHVMVSGQSIAPYAELVPEVVVAGQGGLGTEDCIKRAVKAEIPVVEVP